MDTIIDTRQFPKEMEEKIPPTPKDEKSSFPFLWFIFFLLILFGAYYLYTSFSQKGQGSAANEVKKQNEFIEKVVSQKEKLPTATYERGVSHFFGE